MNEKQVKLFASLAHAKYRKTHNLFLVEGFHAVADLMESDWHVETVLIADPDLRNALAGKKPNCAIVTVSRKTISRIATTKTAQDIIAVARIPDNDLQRAANLDKILVADSVKDPGNMGTMIRTAEALGFDAVVTTAGSVDIFNPKVVRATQGAMFNIVLCRRVPVGELIERIKPKRKLYALSAGSGSDPASIDVEGRIALIVGSEISGVCHDLLTISDSLIRIPISGKAESLNAAVAAGIAIYTLGRQ
jgi:TrmH family RNA methyltransferase